MISSTPPDPTKRKVVDVESIEISSPKLSDAEEVDPIRKGVVTFFNDAKGFGYIIEDGWKKEHFVHISGLIDEIREGDVVEFELKEGKKGLNAVNVKVI